MDEIDPIKIKEFLEELCQSFPEDLIVIGGWAVNAYGCKGKSLDGDAMVSHTVEGTLRDSYLVTKNLRMKKSQFICPYGCDIDLYVERQHGLRIPFDEIQAYSQKKGHLRVAAPEHLILLKVDAYRDRKNTPKGSKDKEDILSLLGKVSLTNKDIFERHMEKEDAETLKEIVSDTITALNLANQNSFEAKILRDKAKKTLQYICENEKQSTRSKKSKDPTSYLQ